MRLEKSDTPVLKDNPTKELPVTNGPSLEDLESVIYTTPDSQPLTDYLGFSINPDKKIRTNKILTNPLSIWAKIPIKRIRKENALWYSGELKITLVKILRTGNDSADIDFYLADIDLQKKDKLVHANLTHYTGIDRDYLVDGKYAYITLPWEAYAAIVNMFVTRYGE